MKDINEVPEELILTLDANSTLIVFGENVGELCLKTGEFKGDPHESAKVFWEHMCGYLQRALEARDAEWRKEIQTCPDTITFEVGATSASTAVASLEDILGPMRYFEDSVKEWKEKYSQDIEVTPDIQDKMDEIVDLIKEE